MGTLTLTPDQIAQLEQLAKIFCSEEEAAGVLGFAVAELKGMLEGEDEAAKAWKRGKAGGKLSLRRLQWRHAQGEGSAAVAMTVHLSKHVLGETDKAVNEVIVGGGKPIVVNIRQFEPGESVEGAAQSVEAVAALKHEIERLLPKEITRKRGPLIEHEKGELNGSGGDSQD